MITPKEIKEKALRLWNNQRFLREYLSGASLFPLTIPFYKPSGRSIRDNFREIRQWVRTIRDESKENKGSGYSLEFEEINHRQLGLQILPSRIFFGARDDFLAYIGKKKEFESFEKMAGQSLSGFPSLEPWLLQNPLRLLKFKEDWTSLLKVCSFFEENPRPGFYIRELEIPGVDTKFIEKHRSILRELLDEILPATAINEAETKLTGHGFERRFGLKFEEPLIRFRLLDGKDTEWAGLEDISIPFPKFQALDPPCKRVFITENKLNGLTFPPHEQGMVIFGLGYGVGAFGQVPWLKERDIFYWGDIDTHGFSILSRLRSCLPHVRSLLMDKETLFRFRKLWVLEEDSKRFTGTLNNLDNSEDLLFTELKENKLGGNVRLEQERVNLSYLKEKLVGL